MIRPEKGSGTSPTIIASPVPRSGKQSKTMRNASEKLDDSAKLQEAVNAFTDNIRRAVGDRNWSLLQSASLHEIESFSTSRRDEMIDVFKAAGLMEVLKKPRVAETSFSTWSCVMNPDVVDALGFAPLEPDSAVSYQDYLDLLAQKHGTEPFDLYRADLQNRSDLLPCMMQLDFIKMDESWKTKTVGEVANLLRPTFKEMDDRYSKLIKYWRRPDIRYSQLSLGLFSIQNDALKTTSTDSRQIH
jgi:hypothetical protein